MRLPRSQLVARIAIGTWLAYSVWLCGRWSDQPTRQTVSDVIVAGFGMLGVAVAVLRARSGWGRQAVAWVIMTVGLAGWVLADAVKTCYPLVTGKTVPFPSIADAGYLSLPVCVCLAFLLAAATSAGQSPLRLLLDGFIVAGSVFIVAWEVILRYLLELGHASTFAFLVMLAYPISDFLVIAVGLVVLAWARLAWRTSAAFLLAGIVVMTVSNDAYFHLLPRGGYARGGLPDIGLAASLLAFALAGLYCRRMPDPDLTKATPPPAAVLWLPYLPLVVASVVVAPEMPRPDPTAVWVGDRRDRRRAGSTVPDGGREPPAAVHRRRAGGARSPHRAGEPHIVQRPAQPYGRAAPPRCPSAGCAVDRPRPLQARQRPPRSCGRRRGADASG